VGTTLRGMEAGATAERKVYTVAAFNRRLAGYVGRVRDVWVEGEVSELRRSPAWGTVFVTLKDVRTGACLPATMLRRRFDLIAPPLGEGERWHPRRRTAREPPVAPGPHVYSPGTWLWWTRAAVSAPCQPLGNEDPRAPHPHCHCHLPRASQ